MEQIDSPQRRTVQTTDGITAMLPEWLRGRRGLLIIAVAVILAGVALNWGWLTAIGVAPILVALAPCALMCAVGLCMKGGSGQSCSKEGSAEPVRNPADGPSN